MMSWNLFSNKLPSCHRVFQTLTLRHGWQRKRQGRGVLEAEPESNKTRYRTVLYISTGHTCFLSARIITVSRVSYDGYDVRLHCSRAEERGGRWTVSQLFRVTVLSARLRLRTPIKPPVQCTRAFLQYSTVRYGIPPSFPSRRMDPSGPTSLRHLGD